MKIISITFHDGINYGAYWQAYCLHKVLSIVSQENAFILDYKNWKHWLMEYLVFYHKLYNPWLFWQNVKKIKNFRKAQQKFKLTQQNKADVAVYGSDEIWNYQNPLFGYDPVYFGYGIRAMKKIAYAPSFGSITGETVLPSEIKKGLSTFEAIFVRDHNTQVIIEKNLGFKPAIVLDPTFLLEVELSAPTIADRNYILVYCTALTPEQIKEARQFAKEKNLRLIAVGYQQEWCDESKVEIGPDQWLGYYKNADYVITTMFHGTIFAIKFNKQFITFVTSYRKNKIYGLLDLLGLTKNIWNEGQLKKILSTGVNYDKVNKLIAQKRKISLELLKKAIKS